MKNITDMKVNQIRIFPVDIVPLSMITSKSCAEKVREAFSFGGVEIGPTVDGRNIIIFIRGEYKRENNVIIVSKIEVDTRRIIIEVEGTSKDGNQVYEHFLSTVATLAHIDLEDLGKPLLTAETTQCVITLDFNFEQMFNSVFIEFLKNNVEKEASSVMAKASVRPIMAAADINYEIIDGALKDNKINMNPKQFSIGLRPGAPAKKRKYFVSSPFDSDTHLKLIDELENAINKAV